MKSKGQLDYEADVIRVPLYHDKTPRVTWEQLSPLARETWERPYWNTGASNGFSESIRAQGRHDFLVKWHMQRGWLNCSHKSLQRLEIEYAAMTKGGV